MDAPTLPEVPEPPESRGAGSVGGSVASATTIGLVWRLSSVSAAIRDEVGRGSRAHERIDIVDIESSFHQTDIHELAHHRERARGSNRAPPQGPADDGSAAAEDGGGSLS